MTVVFFISRYPHVSVCDEGYIIMTAVCNSLSVSNYVLKFI